MKCYSSWRVINGAVNVKSIESDILYKANGRKVKGKEDHEGERETEKEIETQRKSWYV